MDYNIVSDEEILRDLAEKIDHLRITHGIKESEIEKNSGITRKTLYNFKQGKTGLSLKNLIRLLRSINELDRLQMMFPQESTYSPRGTDSLRGKRRVRDKKRSEKEFVWGDEQ